jgi:hypothetical protein
MPGVTLRDGMRREDMWTGLETEISTKEIGNNVQKGWLLIFSMTIILLHSFRVTPPRLN